MATAEANAIYNPRNNPRRMFVGGKHISITHPDHKPGNYKSWNDVKWGQRVPSQESAIVTGEVYIVTNPAYPGWVKVGMAQVSAKDRLKTYQTGSPFRDYEVFQTWAVTDRRKAEAEAHQILKEHFPKRHEWFRCTPAAARLLIEGTLEEYADDSQ